MKDSQEKRFEKFKKAMDSLKWWQINVPQRVLKMTPEEIYCEGFESGYNCRLHELDAIHNKPMPIFKFIENEGEKNDKRNKIKGKSRSN